MTNKNFIRQSKLWTYVKIFAAIYSASSTFRVFFTALDNGRGKIEAGLDSILSVILIDLLFLSVLWFLESDELSLFDKFPLVLVGIGLVVAIIAIGFEEEGTLAFAPRIGLAGLIATDTLRWSAEVVRQVHTNYQHKHSREYIEQQIRNSEVIARKKAMELARKKAFDTLAPEFLQVILDRERKQLGLTEEPISTKQIDFINLTPQTEEVEDGVVRLNDGNFAWRNGNELVTSGSLGRPYPTRIGASRARTRFLNQRNGNGN